MVTLLIELKVSSLCRATLKDNRCQQLQSQQINSQSLNCQARDNANGGFEEVEFFLLLIRQFKFIDFTRAASLTKPKAIFYYIKHRYKI